MEETAQLQALSALALGKEPTVHTGRTLSSSQSQFADCGDQKNNLTLHGIESLFSSP
jgi:hypothetical protein